MFMNAADLLSFLDEMEGAMAKSGHSPENKVNVRVSLDPMINTFRPSSSEKLVDKKKVEKSTKPKPVIYNVAWKSNAEQRLSAFVKKIFINPEKNSFCVSWVDGTYTNITLHEDDVNDSEKALCMCFMKRLFGHCGSFTKDFEMCLKKAVDQRTGKPFDEN